MAEGRHGVWHLKNVFDIHYYFVVLVSCFFHILFLYGFVFHLWFWDKKISSKSHVHCTLKNPQQWESCCTTTRYSTCVNHRTVVKGFLNGDCIPLYSQVWKLVFLLLYNDIFTDCDSLGCCVWFLMLYVYFIWLMNRWLVMDLMFSWWHPVQLTSFPMTNFAR